MSKPTGKKNEVRAILPRPLVLHPGFKKDPELLRNGTAKPHGETESRPEL